MTAGRTLARRRSRLRILLILAVSALAHGAVIVVLLSGLHAGDVTPEVPAMNMNFLPFMRPVHQPPAAPIKTPLHPPPPEPAQHRDPDIAEAAARGPVIVLPSHPEGAGPPTADLPFTSGLRRQLGCASADFLKLTREEREACDARLALADREPPKLAVISPEKKAIFDGDCPKSDAWCLYRTGQGPYPGLFALFSK